MLDYSTDKLEEKNFILFYEEDGDNFKVHCANGYNYSVPNDKENEEKLLEQMEKQIEHSDSFYDKKEKERKHAIYWLIYDSVFLLFDTIMMIVNPSVWVGLAIGCFIIGTIGNSLAYSSCINSL